jgi:serine O-acetyltransferase
MDLTSDFRHMTAAWHAPSARVWLRALPKLLLQPRFRAIVMFRLSQAAWHRGWRFPAYWLQGRAVRTTGAEIHPAATIGPGVCLSHTVGIVIGHESVIGQDAVIYQGVTLGHDARRPGQPRVGDRVRLGAGAKLLGEITVGDDAWIGANAVVLADVPAGARVTGVWKGAEGAADISA